MKSDVIICSNDKKIKTLVYQCPEFPVIYLTQISWHLHFEASPYKNWNSFVGFWLLFFFDKYIFIFAFFKINLWDSWNPNSFKIERNQNSYTHTPNNKHIRTSFIYTIWTKSIYELCWSWSSCSRSLPTTARHMHSKILKGLSLGLSFQFFEYFANL